MAVILIADDDGGVRRLARAALERAGHRVVEATDGTECIARTAEARPTVVILDVFMPGKDGIETVQALKAEHPEVRVLAISGGGSRRLSDDVLRDARLLGADATLSKPFTVKDLQGAVQELVDGS